MAKRGRKKKKGFSYSVEVTGLIFILIGIIGFGFGVVGKWLKGFALFMTGELWFIVLLVLLLLGIFMLFERGVPWFFSVKLVGCYILTLIVLSFAHYPLIDHVLNSDEAYQIGNVISYTYDNISYRISDVTSPDHVSESLSYSGDKSNNIGGGIIGALTSASLVKVAGKVGSTIILIILGLFSLILAFNINVGSLIRKFNDGFEKVDRKKPKPKKEYIVEGDELIGIKDANVKEEEVPVIEEPIKEEKKIVIASIDELKNINEVPNDPIVPTPVIPEDVEKQTFSGPYRLPKLEEVLNPIVKKDNNETQYLDANIKALEKVLNDFEIRGKVVDTHIGPAVTEYEITVPSGTKVSKVLNINKEIALAMAAKDVRIQAPIPGKSTIGIEIPNHEIAAVGIREVLENIRGEKKENKIIVTLGNDIMGKSISCDLCKTPHLLVAGSTGSGKSVCINSIIASILIHYTPDEVKLMLVDPKKVELSNYNGVPHLITPVVCDPKKANIMLQKVVTEMEKRYEIFAEKEIKNIGGYNEWVSKENKKHPEEPIQRMPYIVVIIDELADLMMVASKEVQDSIMRITQMARAAGIHLIVATQRPSTDIITGVIKNNIPSRISFAVSSSIDSRTILDSSGAEKLLGRGDMLFLPMGQNTPTRIQGCFISDEEIAKLIDYVKNQATAKYNEDFTAEDNHSSSAGASNSDGGDDPMYDEVVEFAIETGKISASLIQRRFRFGYNRAARLIDLLESRGIVGPQNGSKPREVLVTIENPEESNEE